MPLRRLACLLLPALGLCPRPAAADETAAAPPGGDRRGQIYGQAPAPLRESDLGASLDTSMIRSVSGLDEAGFRRKWEASLKGALLFFRSYPAAFHKDLAQVAPERIPGAEGLCVGDAHPGNFGFVRVGEHARYVYNDLDDSGYCPIAFDALRYFTALRLLTSDDSLRRAVLERYVDAVKDPDRAAAPPEELEPDWRRLRDEGLDRLTDGNRFRFGGQDGELEPLQAGAREALLTALRAAPRLGAFGLSDVAAVRREAGGSGGLRRYWLLARRRGEVMVLELKEAAPPGVEAGRHSLALTMDERLPLLTAAFWGTRADEDLFYVTAGGVRYLVRDRLGKRAPDLEQLSKKKLKASLLSQASLLAAIHRRLWEGVKKDLLRAWLAESSQVLAERWERARRQAAP